MSIHSSGRMSSDEIVKRAARRSYVEDGFGSVGAPFMHFGKGTAVATWRGRLQKHADSAHRGTPDPACPACIEIEKRGRADDAKV